MEYNKRFKVGQKVICTLGLNKGKEFIIDKIIKDAYSCKAVVADGKNYRYDDKTLEESY